MHVFCECMSHWDRFLHVFLVEQCVIDAQDDPVKQSTVQRFGHRVSGCDSLMRKRGDDKYCNENFIRTEEKVPCDCVVWNQANVYERLN